MKLEDFISEFKKNPELAKAGMILFHNGIVRETSRDGRKVTGLSVKADIPLLDSILEKYRQKPGIVDVRAVINSGVELKIGDDVMYLGVAGDIRENVIKTLEDCLNEIKSAVTSKTEFFKK